MRRSGERVIRGSRARRRRVGLEDLPHDVTPLGHRVEGEAVDLVVHPAQHSPVATRLGRDVSRGFLDQADLVDLRERECVRRVGVAHDERVAGELDEAQIPQRGAGIEGQLPPVLRHAGPRGDEAERQDESGPHAGFAPTFPVTGPSLPRLRLRAFSRLRLRALPCVPRKILPRLVRRSPLPMRSVSQSVVRYFDPPSTSSRLYWSGDAGITDSRPIRTSARSANARSFLISASGTGRGSLSPAFRSTTASLGSFCLGSGYASEATSATPTTAFSSPVW